MNEPKYIEYCRTVISGLCIAPDSLKVEMSTDERGVLLTVYGVKKGDMPRVIGANGRIIEAIRLLVRSVSRAEGAIVSIKIAEPT